MKNYKLFKWALKRMKVVNGEYVRCLRNKFMLFLMNISGVTPEDIIKEFCENLKKEDEAA